VTDQHTVVVRADSPARTTTAGRVVEGTTPYPWPWDAAFAPTRCALLTVGIEGPTPELAEPALHVAERAADAARAAGALVVRVVTRRPANGRAAAADVAGPPTDGDVVYAAGLDGFFGSGLDLLLRRHRRDQLLFAGYWLETAVHSTLRSANDRGYECLVLADACTSLTPGTRSGALSTIEMSGGIFGAIGFADAAIVAMSNSPTTEGV
jgi:nicotinamidase-related amidase